MAKQKLQFKHSFKAPRGTVFAFFADHTKFATIFGIPAKRVVDAPKGSDLNGLGSVRRMGSPGLKFEETIVTYQPGKLIEYTVTKGGPIKNHLGRIEFIEERGGSRVEYSIVFEPKIPLTGQLIANILKTGWQKGIAQAARSIEQS